MYMSHDTELKSRQAEFARRARSQASVVLSRARRGANELDEASDKTSKTLDDLELLLQSLRDDSSRGPGELGLGGEVSATTQVPRSAKSVLL